MVVVVHKETFQGLCTVQIVQSCVAWRVDCMECIEGALSSRID